MTPARLIVAEPQAAYLQRPKLVVDASVMTSLVFVEVNARDAESWLRGRALCAPHFLDAEVANAGLNKIRRRSLAQTDVFEALRQFGTLDIQRFRIKHAEVVEMAARYALSAYDGAYLWLASHLGAPLATFDARLGEVAQRHLGGARGPG
jgi:predicted nucleic acid-binding protein